MKQKSEEPAAKEKATRYLLSDALLEKVKPYIHFPSNRYDLPRSSNGRTRVYFLKELPIVLKHTGFPENQKRFDKMKQAYEICEKNGYEHLIIPRACIYGDFIIENRLPIVMDGTKEQIGLYIENRERFTEAVKEFTGFLFQSNFNDITAKRGKDPYETLSETPIGRYDNVALYLEGEQGKIGLIDLEKFEPECNKLPKNWCLLKCKDVIHLFPYHFNAILDVAKNFDPDIKNYHENLEIERDGALRRFKLVYEDHLNFIKEKCITLETPVIFERLALNRIEQLKNVLEKRLRKEHEDILFRGCLGENPDKTLADFNEKAFPKILDAIYTLISKRLEFNLKKNGSKEISSIPKLLSIRTLEFWLSYAYDEYEFLNSLSLQLEMLTFKGRNYIRNFISILLDVILKELERGKEIVYYNPHFRSYGQCIIFC